MTMIMSPKFSCGPFSRCSMRAGTPSSTPSSYISTRPHFVERSVSNLSFLLCKNPISRVVVSISQSYQKFFKSSALSKTILMMSAPRSLTCRIVQSAERPAARRLVFFAPHLWKVGILTYATHVRHLSPWNCFAPSETPDAGCAALLFPRSALQVLLSACEA